MASALQYGANISLVFIFANVMNLNVQVSALVSSYMYMKLPLPQKMRFLQ